MGNEHITSNYEDPIRAELFSTNHLEKHSEAIAASHTIFTDPSKGINLAARVAENEKILIASFAAIIKTLQEQRAITPASEWLIDNFHIVEEQIRDIRNHLPPKYYRQLPKLSSGDLTGYPRVYGIVWEFVSHTDSLFDPELLKKFVRSYQKVQVLTIGELWALSITLRVVLIENLRRLSTLLVGSQSARQEADHIADELLGLDHKKHRPNKEILDSLANYPLNSAFIAQLVQRLRFQEGKATIALDWLDARLAKNNVVADTVIHDEHVNQTAANSTVRNIITSMRLISAIDWQDFFEDISLVDDVLRKSTTYGKMDFITRDRYRHGLEDLARSSKKSEIEIATKVIEKTKRVLSTSVAQNKPIDEKQIDVGYYLVSGGRYDFEKEIGFNLKLRQRLLRWYVCHGKFFYIGGIALLSLLFVYLCSSQQVPCFLYLLALFPASDIAMSLVNRLTVKILGPKHLPRLDLTTGIPVDMKTFVVVPTFLANAADIANQVEQLEVHYLSNPDNNLHFALLSDWIDADEEHVASDQELLSIAKAFINNLNTKYELEEEWKKRFFVFHRKRLWNTSERKWIGWERKRGKLSEFNRLLRGTTDTSFLTTKEELACIPQNVKYVITLDADTKLPRGAVGQLVGTFAHPLNHPKFNTKLNRVVEGYGILQPRITPTLPEVHDNTLFQRISSGPCGVDPYVSAVSDVYQDLFGEGSYTGKGIYNVDVFEQAMYERVPENRLLSHDLFEGNFARCGLLSDVEFFEDFPSHFDVSISRAHRWTRGDWQLLPWILGREGNAISLIGRFKMFDNLRRSLSSPMTFFLLIAGFALPTVNIFPWEILSLISLGLPHFFPFFSDLIGFKKKLSFISQLRVLKEDCILGLGRFFFNIVFLPYHSWIFLDAIIRTFIRLIFTKRKLLEWTTSAQAKTGASLALQSFFGRMILIEGIIILTGFFIFRINPEQIFVSAPFFIFWLLSPVFAWKISLPPPKEKLNLTEEDVTYLKNIARKTWHFFETFVTAEENFLPPDNFQVTPEPIIAHRSSPTNFGLYLLSVLSARDFGWITISEMADRLDTTLRVMQNLPRHNGHFFNWYRTTDCRPLEPQYISSVDNGNLVGHLIAVAQACTEDSTNEDLREKLKQIATICRQLINEMNFDFLYDHTRKLFSIGFRMSDRSLDASYYDLLASEARLLSFVAIAKGDIPSTHWFHLGRSLTTVKKGNALVSWSGSMFEYLMPSLVMHTPNESLLEQTSRLIVQTQISYGKEKNVPWGISESAYNTRDLHLTYQYSNFGVPELGLKRGLGQDLVIAPYATMLASMINPLESVQNLKQLAKYNLEGSFGFYESIDFTEVRLPEKKKSVIVKTYMAHHQGMSLVAIANLLLGSRMKNRFHREPMVQATALLLQERTPRNVSIPNKRKESIKIDHVNTGGETAVRRYYSPRYSVPRTHLLANGHYSVMLTAAGSGYSRFRDISITRWREDVTRDHWGSYIFLKDIQTSQTWSAGFQPTCVEADNYEVVFMEDRAKFLRVDKNITSHLEIFVSPEDNTEIRRLTLTNTGSVTKYVEITSYAEIVLNTQAADVAHPAFSNLFVQTEFVKEISTLIASRRPRSDDEAQVWMAHVIATDSHSFGEIEFETDRMRFIGRGCSIQNPYSITNGKPLSNTVGSVLDPIVSLRTRVKINPGTSTNITYSTIVGSTREEVLKLAEKSHDVSTFNRISTLAWTDAQIRLHYLNIEYGEASFFQQLANRILYLDSSLRPSSDILKKSKLDITGLWGHGISGDYPIVLLRIDDIEDRTIVRQLLQAHEYWCTKQLLVDLVILNEKTTSYSQDLYKMLEAMVGGCSYSSGCFIPQAKGKVFILKADVITPEERYLLQTAARATLVARNGNLAEQVKRLIKKPEKVFKGGGVIATLPDYFKSSIPIPPLDFFNGLGGFANDGKEYLIRLNKGENTPAPWINVIANSSFGFHVSERGASSTWSVNSRENQITPWSNDPVSDPSGECFYIFDKNTGHMWGPTISPIRIDEAEYIIRHGQGYSKFELIHQGIHSTLTQFVSPDLSVKISKISLKNNSALKRELTLTSYIEWVLGFTRTTTNPHIVTELDEETGAIFSYNPWNQEFGKRISFATFIEGNDAWTCDRTEFLGRNGNVAKPNALLNESVLLRKTGAGMDACAVLQKDITIEAHQEVSLIFLLGQTENRETARDLLVDVKNKNINTIFSDVLKNWDNILDKIKIETPDLATNLMLNRWLLYQNIVCRLWARSAFYQTGGAYGFRDQLQDSMAMIWSRPEMTKAQILRTAARQFVDGDVQHWWHIPSGRGVRTHFSDDLLWLPFVVSYYVKILSDKSILDEVAPFLVGQELPLEKEDSYYTPEVTAQTSSIYEHCARALDRSLQLGIHGLPLIGTGDWNDGMNRVGHKGKGESVWLAWFLIINLTEFSKIAESRGDIERFKIWSQHALKLKKAIENEAWDGAWYRRAFYDDGTPLGSSESLECRIDSLAQTWGVISGAGDHARLTSAMEAVEKFLIKTADQMILLFTPPFDKTPMDPGYIKGYLPGVRENGGQYSHAAIWCIFAYTGLNQGQRAVEIFSMLNPINHAKNITDIERYKVEPYVMAADVYSQEPHVGRGGWTWYTGSSAWMYRAGIEGILGFNLVGNKLKINPCISPTWKGYKISYRHGNSSYLIEVRNPKALSYGMNKYFIDGEELSGSQQGVTLVDDGLNHIITVDLM